MDPIMLQLGPLAVRWYGFLIALGVALGTARAALEARRRGPDEEEPLDMAVATRRPGNRPRIPR